MVTAFVMINTAPQAVSKVAQAVANLEHVAEVYSVTGEFDLIAIVRLSSYELLAEAVPDSISRVEGITRTTTVLAFRSFSREEMEAAWDIGLS